MGDTSSVFFVDISPSVIGLVVDQARMIKSSHGGLSVAAAPDDAQLCAAVVAGELQALQQLYDRHASLVYGLARAILNNEQEAEDLTQEIFLSLLKRIPYDPARGTLAGYLTTLTRSRAIDLLRARKRSQRLLDAVTPSDELTLSNTPLDVNENDECARAVRTALAALPAAQRTVLQLAYFKGLSQSEIAAALSAPLGTVKTWARSGLTALRDALKNFVDTTP